MSKEKVLVYHFYKGLVYFDKIFDDVNKALDYIKANADPKRHYSFEKVEYESGFKTIENTTQY